MSNIVIIAVTGVLLVFALALVVSVDYRGTEQEEEQQSKETPDVPQNVMKAEDPEDEDDVFGFYLVGDRKKRQAERGSGKGLFLLSGLGRHGNGESLIDRNVQNAGQNDGSRDVDQGVLLQEYRAEADQ